MPAARNGGGQVEAYRLNWMDDAADGTGASTNPRRGMEPIEIYDQDGNVKVTVPAIKNMVVGNSGQAAQWHFTNNPALNGARSVTPVRVNAVTLPSDIDPTSPIPWETYKAALEDAIASDGIDESNYVLTAIPRRFGIKRSVEDDVQGQGGYATIKHTEALNPLTNIVETSDDVLTWLDPFQIIVNTSGGYIGGYLVLYFFVQRGETTGTVYLDDVTTDIGIPIGTALWSSAGGTPYQVWPATATPRPFSDTLADMSDLKAWRSPTEGPKQSDATGSIDDAYIVIKLPSPGEAGASSLNFTIHGAGVESGFLYGVHITGVAKGMVSNFKRASAPGLVLQAVPPNEAPYDYVEGAGWVDYIAKSPVFYYFPGIDRYSLHDFTMDTSADFYRIGDFLEIWNPDYFTGSWGDPPLPPYSGNPYIVPSAFFSYGQQTSFPLGSYFASWTGADDAKWSFSVDLKSGIIFAGGREFVPSPPGSQLGPTWQPGADYNAGDIVWDVIAGQNYIVLYPHTAAAIFNPRQKLGNRFLYWPYP
ncbi:MAG: hypothetical protein U1E62_05495 [Alsobacter sp.]